MSPPLSIRLQSRGCCRLEEEHKLLRAQLVRQPPIPAAERYRVELVKARRHRDSAVASTEVVFDASDSAQSCAVAFDLSALVDDDGLSTVRHGTYFLRATPLEGSDLRAESADFPVRLLTSHRLRTDYLHGLDKLPADVLTPRYQPRVVTGVEIAEVEPGTQPGFYPLSLNVDATGQQTLQWAGGDTVPIQDDFDRFALPDNRDGWIEVRISDPTLLPDQPQTESILIERTRIDDQVLGRFIDRATDWLELTTLQLFLEPTILSTDGKYLPRVNADASAPAPLDWDIKAPALTHHVYTPGKWAGLKFPYPYITKIFGLTGQIARSPVFELPVGWVQVQERNGWAQIVPFHEKAAFSLFYFLKGDLLRGGLEIPNFWHFAIRAGLRHVPGDVVEAIAKKAALDALTAIGQAFKPGVGSNSFSKDISVSASYVRTAQANLLSATRAEYKADLDTLIPQLRSRYLGLANTTVV